MIAVSAAVMDVLREESSAFSEVVQTTVTTVILRIRRETLPDEGFWLIRLRTMLILSLNAEHVTVVAFVSDFVPLTTELSFVLRELRAALFSFRVFSFLTKAVLS